MTCTSPRSSGSARSTTARERIRTQLQALMQRFGCDVPAVASASTRSDDALATALMDAFRRTRDQEVFDGLIRWVGPQLSRRVRARARGLGAVIDPEEALQDTVVNIYRYPDRFLASRPGAFAAWSATIADNAVRRLLRKAKRGACVSLRDPELLQQRADAAAPEPCRQAELREECAATSAAFGLVLRAYLISYQRLSERERTVLQMVEVRRMRYAELGELLQVRPDALKMVVFRARKRLRQHLARLLRGERPEPAATPRRARRRPAALAVA